MLISFWPARSSAASNVQLWLALSRIQAKYHRLAAAQRSYAEARRLDPFLPAPN